jgi:rSAM/selenodomain-associated transferase 1
VAYKYPDCVQLVFCKAPVPGQVKTRLIPALSAEQAAELHQRLTRITIERALQNRLCPVQLRCAPDIDHPFFQRCAQDYSLTLHRQHGKDLGERMHHALVTALAHYSHAILTGCDCPSLTPVDLQQALSALENGYDVVIAPAQDGGYVLVGLSRPQAVLFENIPWGSDKVLQLTREKAALASLSLYELASQWDVDNPEDLERLRGIYPG